MEEQSLPNIAGTSGMSQELAIIFELVTDKDRSEGDVALVFAVGRETVSALELEDCIVRSIYTGQKGGFLVEVITRAAQFTWNYHEEIIADLSGLVTIFGSIVPILKRMCQIHEKYVGKEERAASPIKIKIEIDGAPIIVEAPDVARAEAALKLAHRYYSIHPDTASHATIKSKVKIQGQIPPRKRRQRR